MRATVIGKRTQRRRYPVAAPTREYVAIPPASLSIFAVISPGPTIDNKMKIFARNGDIFFLLEILIIILTFHLITMEVNHPQRQYLKAHFHYL